MLKIYLTKTIQTFTTLGYLTILLALMVALYAYYFHEFRFFVVQSGSMEPTIPVGSVVVTKPTTQLTVGTVITYQVPGAVVSHRIVDEVIQNGRVHYRTQGDANQTVDKDLVAQSAIIGSVQNAIPEIGKLILFAKTPPGYISLVIIPSMYLLVSGILALQTGFRRPKNVSTTTTALNALILMILACSHFTGSTSAFFTSTATSSGNSFMAADSFPQTVGLFQSNTFTCVDGASETTQLFGSVVMTVGATNLMFTVEIVSGTPNASYDIWVNQHPGACPLGVATFPGGMNTNESGNATETFETPLQSGATSYWISAVGGGQVLRSVAVN